MLPTAWLSLPAPGDRTVERLLRKVRLLAVRTLLTTHGGATLSRVQAWLTRSLRARPDAVLEAVGHPDVLAPLLVLTAGLRPAQAMLDQAVPALLVELGAPVEDVLWDRAVDLRGERSAGVFVTRQGAQLQDGRPIPATRDVPCGPVLFGVGDTNPLADLEEHPDKDGNAVDLGGRTPAEWVEALEDAIGLIEYLPGWYEELPSSCKRLIPVGYHPERHLSASYREAPGVVYLTLHPSRLTLAEAIVHEVQHSKLNLLSRLDPILHNGRTEWTASPVRPDMRPLMGVLLAAHAFVPVAALHHALAEAGVCQGPDFERRRADVLATNREALDIVWSKGEPSDHGRRLIHELDGLQRFLEQAT
ncbi:MAG: hypothetical protein GY913_18115 [Proteobacteria bacterium]|nr:hypothetical protein [Pseudomonadota bacterium]MCP4918824.1 hypothetical protein [Pseudomonadota bacterium]